MRPRLELFFLLRRPSPGEPRKPYHKHAVTFVTAGCPNLLNNPPHTRCWGWRGNIVFNAGPGRRSRVAAVQAGAADLSGFVLVPVALPRVLPVPRTIRSAPKSKRARCFTGLSS